MRIIKAGATSQTIYIEVLDSTSTNGGRKTGLVFNSAGLTAYYARTGGLAVAITLATLAAANSAYSSGGFKEVDATNMPGIYRLDLPDAAVASGVPSVVITIKGATGMVQVSVEIQLTAMDTQDAVRAGLTALPNAAAEAAGGLYTRGSGAGQINQPANGQIDVNVERWNATAVPAEHTVGYPVVTIKDGTGTGEIDTTGGAIVQVNQLGTQAKADVNAEVVDALNVDTYAEPSSVPAATSSLADKVRWLFTLARNKVTQTATTQTLRNDADAANIATSTDSDDGTTYIRGEWT